MKPHTKGLIIGIVLGVAGALVASNVGSWLGPFFSPTSSDLSRPPTVIGHGPHVIPPEQSGPDIARQIRPSVVEISYEMETYRRLWPNVRKDGKGTGFIFDIDDDGNYWILTNSHVLGFDEMVLAGKTRAPEVVSYVLSISAADGQLAEVLTVFEHIEHDAAIVVVSKDLGALRSLKMALEDAEVGEVIYAMGHPHGYQSFFTSGIVSARMDEFLAIDAAINPGNSGGPLVNNRAEVVGMNTMKDPGGEALGFALRIGLLRDLSGYVEVDITDLDALRRHVDRIYFPAN